VDMGSLHHRPPEPRRSPLGNTTMPREAYAGESGRGETRVARQLIPRPEPVDVAYLGLHQHRDVVTDPEDGREKPDVLIVGRDVPELQAKQPDLLPQGRHQPQVTVHGLQAQTSQTFPPLPGEHPVLLRRLYALVGEDAPDLHLEQDLLPHQEGPTADLLPEHRDVEWGHVALGQAVQPEKLRQRLGVHLARLDAGLRDVPDLLRM